ncbi:MAG: pilus assembly protein PilZ [Moraxella sp.]|nr:pilus assembly protein PilZ [Moraxella sp.]
MAMPIRGGGIITCNFTDTDTLYASYLPFVTNGAIFVPSARGHHLGEDVFVAITLPDSPDRYPLNGKIIWINHKASAGKPAGFAVQFGTDPNSIRIKNEVERLLAGQLDSPRPTFTM